MGVTLLIGMIKVKTSPGDLDCVLPSFTRADCCPFFCTDTLLQVADMLWPKGIQHKVQSFPYVLLKELGLFL